MDDVNGDRSNSAVKENSTFGVLGEETPPEQLRWRSRRWPAALGSPTAAPRSCGSDRARPRSPSPPSPPPLRRRRLPAWWRWWPSGTTSTRAEPALATAGLRPARRGAGRCPLRETREARLGRRSAEAPGRPSDCRRRRSPRWATWPTSAGRRPSWPAARSPPRAGLGNRARPAAGNDEYGRGQADDYFRDLVASAPGKHGEGWTVPGLVDWHVVVLNSNCGLCRAACAPGSGAEEVAGRSTMAAHDAKVVRSPS